MDRSSREMPHVNANNGRATKQNLIKRAQDKPISAKTQLGFPEVRIAAQGQWERIHRALGVNLPSTSHMKHTACPGCGGKDRFRVGRNYAETGQWFCSGQGEFQQGDGFNLLGHVFGWSGKEQLQAVADVLGLSRLDPQTRDQIQQQATREAEKRAALAQAKEERERLDQNLLDAIASQEDETKKRRNLQRIVRASDSSRLLPHSIDELKAGRVLIHTLLDTFATSIPSCSEHIEARAAINAFFNRLEHRA